MFHWQEILLLATVFYLISFWPSCNIPDEIRSNSPVAITWSLDSIQIDPEHKSFISLKLRNTGNASLEQNWRIFYNQIAAIPVAGSLPSEISIRHLGGDYFECAPTQHWKSLAPGDSIAIRYAIPGHLRRISQYPKGMYTVIDNGAPALITPLTVRGINRETLSGLDMPGPESRFRDNAAITPQDDIGTPVVIPSPANLNVFKGWLELDSTILVSAPAELENEMLSVRKLFKQTTGLPCKKGPPEQANVRLVLTNDTSQPGDESYELVVDDTGISITGGSPTGIFYGVQTLKGIIPLESFSRPPDTLKIPHVRIEDRPRFQYRGLHVDVARNFHDKEHLQKVIEKMAFFKLNRLHLTLTNDEGWRIEIPGLPELTEVGSKRGHSEDERKRLNPAYGSGPYPVPPGTGFYSREEFIDILRFAQKQHVRVIPEIDVPGHARAAIRSMSSRYFDYAEKGDMATALEYLLHDPEDRSEYASAQRYDDNVLCVCQESTYRFIEKVIRETVRVYRDAGAPLQAMHFGGDEVPYGAWQKSPVCDTFMQNTPEVSSSDQLNAYFFGRLREILEKYDLTLAGWEEIALKTTPEGYHGTDINFDLKRDRTQLYVWNSVWGWGREDMAYRLANAGFPVVMCNSSALYFDQAYNADPGERGLAWSGYVDTKKAFYFDAEHMFETAREDIEGRPLRAEYLAAKIRLTDTGKQHILGIQGQLWSETISNSTYLEYYLFPKLIALAERAWAPRPQWVSVQDSHRRFELLHAEWSEFANKVGQKILPKLDVMGVPVKYRIPLPGAIVRNDTLYANIRYPGLQIRFTTDGTEPVMTSREYTGPVKIARRPVKLKAFTGNGRGSRTSVIPD